VGHGMTMVNTPDEAHVIVDDIYDSGATAEYYQRVFPNKLFRCLIDKREPRWKDKWIVLPWEVTRQGTDLSADDIVTRLLQFLGEDPHREGLKDTPKRVLKAWKEWGQGYQQDPKSVLKSFTDGAKGVDELVIVHNIPVISKCEHHLADITGIAHVGYIPDGKIVGLSKLPRLVDLFARRLQVQERLTNQVADALVEGLAPKGVGVVIRAAHACMSTRGVKIQNSVTTTSAMRGALLEKGPARQEFLSLCDAAERHNG
jgi:GTP cyclohydrolase I